jgi:hypothetical protein
MFPALPPLLLALALSRGPLLRRAGLCLLFLASMLAVVLLVANRWEGHAGAVGVPDLLWTGKGVGTGFGGFSIDKLRLLAAGIGEYWWGGHNLTTMQYLEIKWREWLPSLLLQAVLLAFLASFFWQRRSEGRWRATAIVFLGTLAAGQVMNAYSQPQDPQMQLNVMPWLTLAWILPLSTWPQRRALTVAAAAVTFVPLAYNVAAMSAWRGLDGREEADLAALERVADPARTVFVYQGFEPLTTWHFARWTQRWDGVCDLGPAPLAQPKFKWIRISATLLAHPSWTPAEHVAALRAELDCACDKGYRLVAASIWGIPAEQFAGNMISIADRNTLLALHGLMAGYRRTPITGLSLMPSNGTYSEIACPKSQ